MNPAPPVKKRKDVNIARPHANIQNHIHLSGSDWKSIGASAFLNLNFAKKALSCLNDLAFSAVFLTKAVRAVLRLTFCDASAAEGAMHVANIIKAKRVNTDFMCVQSSNR